MTTTNTALKQWVDEVAKLTQPDKIYWCNGSEAEYSSLIEQMLATGTLIKLNEKTHPNCYLHRSNPTDVARVEHLTFVCTENQEDAGPNNNWMDPQAANAKIDALFQGAMKGRTMYVIPYCMGPVNSPYSRCGVEISDSPYVVANMRIMANMGAVALARIEREGAFVKGLHSTGDLDPNKRFIMHFPETLTIKSIGSGYGGNALLGKKCHALRIASYQARTEGWLAEHMLIMGIQNPAGKTHYIAAAFPSACGKTNLSMMLPPDTMPGWKIWTLGDDICWLNVGSDGRLWAINPETGYFGVAPGTNLKTNPNAYKTVQHDTIFTNVALTADNQPWWEGMKEGTPAIDWLGRPYDPKNGPAAHPNSRFTVSAKQNPCYSPHTEDPAGVPISAILFGGRRRELAPLVYEARDWAHGVLMGAGMASETTAAAVGQVGVVRRDPMAMKPFCGYNYGDYWQHWLSFEGRASNLPKVYHVNWFRQDKDHNFMWPGFSDNLRVLSWIFDRCEGKVGAHETPIGYLPAPSDLNTSGLDIQPDTLQELLSINPAAWRAETLQIAEYLNEFGNRTPARLKEKLGEVQKRLA
ncbi:MAG: phosphoenolpyruvate carboxykinase (GTP) [Steroidobacteraceae bacterium]